MLFTSERRQLDTRTAITMWDLAVWAYQRQMVQFETDRAEPSVGAFSRSAGWLAATDGGMRGANASERGCINGAGTTAHEDAHIVHAHVRALGRAGAELVVNTAARGRPPVWDPSLPVCRIIPVRKGGGSIRMIYGKSNRPIACMIAYEGVPDCEARAIREQARETYSRWWEALRGVRLSLCDAGSLERWKVTAMGAEREPWK